MAAPTFARQQGCTWGIAPSPLAGVQSDLRTPCSDRRRKTRSSARSVGLTTAAPDPGAAHALARIQASERPREVSHAATVSTGVAARHRSRLVEESPLPPVTRLVALRYVEPPMAWLLGGGTLEVKRGDPHDLLWIPNLCVSVTYSRRSGCRRRGGSGARLGPARRWRSFRQPGVRADRLRPR